MPKRPSMSHQIGRVFDFQPGRSRHNDKANGTDDRHIHSYETARSYRRAVNGLLRALPREDRPQYVKDIDQDTVRKGLDTLRQRSQEQRGKDLSRATIDKLLAALRKFDTLRRARGWASDERPLVTPDMRSQEPRRVRGGYDDPTVEKIREAVADDPQCGDEELQMFDTIAASGLRNNEAARLKADDVDRQDGSIRVRKSSAKGGRERTVGDNLDRTGREQLRDTIETLPDRRDNYLWSNGRASARRLQDAIRQACKRLGITSKGLHGLRGNFAERFLRREMDRRINDGASARDAEREARYDLTDILGHNRIDVTYKYAPQLA